MAEDRNNVVAFDDDPFGDPPEGKKKFLYPRLLRTYTRVAHQDHFCDRCCNPIMPGEEYEARVEVTRRGHILVWKNHINPGCDYPEDPDEIRDDVEEDLDVSEAA